MLTYLYSCLFRYSHIHNHTLRIIYPCSYPSTRNIIPLPCTHVHSYLHTLHANNHSSHHTFSHQQNHTYHTLTICTNFTPILILTHPDWHCYTHSSQCTCSDIHSHWPTFALANTIHVVKVNSYGYIHVLTKRQWLIPPIAGNYRYAHYIFTLPYSHLCWYT